MSTKYDSYMRLERKAVADPKSESAKAKAAADQAKEAASGVLSKSLDRAVNATQYANDRTSSAASVNDHEWAASQHEDAAAAHATAAMHASGNEKQAAAHTKAAEAHISASDAHKAKIVR